LRIRWLSCCLLILFVSVVQAFDGLVIDAVMDTEARTISGSVSFDVCARDVDLPELRFQLYPNLHCADDTACGIKIDSLTVREENLSSVMTIDGTDLSVPLNSVALSGKSIAASIWFTTHLPVGNPRVGFSGDQYLLAEWFPVLAPWRDNQWQRISYRKYLEPSVDLTDIKATISYPDSLQLIAPGILGTESIEGTTTAQIELNAASGAPLLFGTGYHLDSTAVLNAALKVYFRERDRFALDTVRSAATAALEYMSDYVLAYPFDELIVVIGGLAGGGGLEQPRMILASVPPRTITNGFYASMIVHEVIHQWFYGIVNSSQAEAPWLDESVTDYLTLKIGRHCSQGQPDLFDLFGLTANRLTIRRMEARSVMETDPITRPGDRFYDRTTYIRAVYGKGTLILQTLMALMGEEQEQLFWREYADSFQYAVPQPEDFVRLADKYLPAPEGTDVRTILDHTLATDFAVVSLSTEMITPPGEEDDGVAEDSLEWKVSIEYLARHPLGFPVDLKVVFLDGSVIDTVLNPTPGRHKIEYTAASPAVAAIIDPEFKYVIDDDFLNNSLTREQSRGAALRLFSGVTFLVESLFSSLWGW